MYKKILFIPKKKFKKIYYPTYKAPGVTSESTLNKIKVNPILTSSLVFSSYTIMENLIDESLYSKITFKALIIQH